MTIPPVALITGGGSGIGRETAKLLAIEHCRLALVGRNESKLQDTVDLLAGDVADPPDTLMIAADISDREQASSAVDMTLQQWGRVDYLINNAGIAPLDNLEDADTDRIYQLFAINAFGPLYLVQRCWDSFVKHRSGCVVNVSSMSAISPFPGLGIYGMAKSAVDGLTRAIMTEGEPHGISAYSVAPGAVETSMLRANFDSEMLPMEHTLPPEAVAQVIVDCARGRRGDDAGTVIALPSP